MQHTLFQRALDDLVQGFRLWRIWLTLGYQDIRLRYRRSIIGPFWITLSMAVMIYSMGFLYAKLFKVDLQVYYPFIAAGMVTWNYIALNISESTEILATSSNFIKQIKLPYTIYILRLLTRNTLVLLHNMLAIIPIIFIFNVPVSLLSLCVLILNMGIVNLCGFNIVYMISILGTRFQDIRPIIMSIVQILFLLTPVIWMPSMIPERYTFLSEFNPFYQMISLIREPLLGNVPSLFTYGYALFCLLTGFILMFLLLWRCRHRIAFWV